MGIRYPENFSVVQCSSLSLKFLPLHALTIYVQRANNNASNQNLRISRRPQTSKALVAFKKPSPESEPAAGNKQYLKKIFATNPVFANGQWCIYHVWHELDDVYHEHISLLISAIIYH